jgi:hypothetical protein
MFYAPVESRFGKSPPWEEEILRTFLGDSPFVVAGPPGWNALGLGTTAVFAATLVYNQKRTCEFTFDGRRFLLRRVLFPLDPPPEWFVIDLLGASRVGRCLALRARGAAGSIASLWTFGSLAAEGHGGSF